MGNYQRQAVINDLKQAVCEVTFIKVNGERRVMRCTLDSRYMPPMTFDQQNHLEEQYKKPENKEVIACWDVQSGGWRSFRVDSIQYMQEIDGY
jgi:predicted DNA-binding transcriptional regulator YafY